LILQFLVASIWMKRGFIHEAWLYPESLGRTALLKPDKKHNSGQHFVLLQSRV
jgi:hypothetical protein